MLGGNGGCEHCVLDPEKKKGNGINFIKALHFYEVFRGRINDTTNQIFSSGCPKQQLFGGGTGVPYLTVCHFAADTGIGA